MDYTEDITLLVKEKKKCYNTIIVIILDCLHVFIYTSSANVLFVQLGVFRLLLRIDSSNLPCLYSIFHLEYPLVLSRFCIEQDKLSTPSSAPNIVYKDTWRQIYILLIFKLRIYVFKKWSFSQFDENCTDENKAIYIIFDINEKHDMENPHNW